MLHRGLIYISYEKYVIIGTQEITGVGGGGGCRKSNIRAPILLINIWQVYSHWLGTSVTIKVDKNKISRKQPAIQTRHVSVWPGRSRSFGHALVSVQGRKDFLLKKIRAFVYLYCPRELNVQQTMAPGLRLQNQLN